jgi:hypothetical protein
LSLSFDQPGSPIVPVWAPVVVDVSAKTTRPNTASGSWVHVVKHADGASTIHSAESVSGDRIRDSVENDAPVVTSPSSTVTALASTATLAATVSPGRIVNGNSTGGAGKSWYQAE